MNLFSAYSVLGVHPGCSDIEIKSRHRILSQMYHPDRDGGNPERFMEVQEAFRMIKDAPARRLLATQLMGLGRVCPVCDGRGFTRKQKKFVAVSKTPCDHCGSCGYVPY